MAEDDLDRALRNLGVDPEALAIEALQDYLRVIRKYGRKSPQARTFLERHEYLKEHLDDLVWLANFFNEAKELGVFDKEDGT